MTMNDFTEYAQPKSILSLHCVSTLKVSYRECNAAAAAAFSYRLYARTRVVVFSQRVIEKTALSMR